MTADLHNPYMIPELHSIVRFFSTTLISHFKIRNKLCIFIETAYTLSRR